MPSSISSSEQNRLPGGGLKALILGLLIAIVLLGGWEIFWRRAGFHPVIEDELGIWAVNRRALKNEQNNIIVLLGSSRMQLDVDPKIIEAETGYKTVMLAIDGSSPLPVLEDLARDTSFKGRIICALLPQWLGDNSPGKSRSAKWVRKYHKQKWSFWIETRLSLFLQAHFVSRYPGILPGKLWEKFQAGEFPLPPYAPMREDRYRPADYSITDISRLKLTRLKRQQEIAAAAQPMTAHDFSARIRKINTLVHQIQTNGSDVLFIRLPSCDGILELEEQTWPRRKYWDVFTAEVPARSLHFVDYPQLNSFTCPDGSHLDNRDAKLFTKALIPLLEIPEQKSKYQ